MSGSPLGDVDQYINITGSDFTITFTDLEGHQTFKTDGIRLQYSKGSGVSGPVYTFSSNRTILGR